MLEAEMEEFSGHPRRAYSALPASALENGSVNLWRGDGKGKPEAHGLMNMNSVLYDPCDF